MLRPNVRPRNLFRLLMALLGIAFLVSVIRRAGAAVVVDQLKIVGWGLGIALGGISHLTKTLGCRLTFRSLFWKGIGFVGLLAMSRSTERSRRGLALRYNAVEVS